MLLIFIKTFTEIKIYMLLKNKNINIKKKKKISWLKKGLNSYVKFLMDQWMPLRNINNLDIKKNFSNS